MNNKLKAESIEYIYIYIYITVQVFGFLSNSGLLISITTFSFAEIIISLQVSGECTLASTNSAHIHHDLKTKWLKLYTLAADDGCDVYYI